MELYREFHNWWQSKASPTPIFSGTDGEKWTQRHARLHGNTAHKMERISMRRCQAQRPIFIYLFHSKVALQLGQSQGRKYLQKSTKPNPKNIYEGINNLESPQSNKLGPSLSSIGDCCHPQKNRDRFLLIPVIRSEMQ